MDDSANPWLCGKCGYTLKGLGQDAKCPECGSGERVFDIAQIYRVSNIKYSCAFTSAACLIFAVSLIASTFGSQPAYYGLSSWWLLLGWLAGAVVYLVGISTLSNAQFNHFATQKLPIRFAYATWLLGVGSVLILFKSTYDENGWLLKIEPGTLRIGLFSSPAIALTSALLPALLATHFKVIKRARISRKLFITAGGLLVCASALISLYFLIWLDWTVGIDLYLSQSGGHANSIAYGLKASALLGACASIYGFVAGILAYRSAK